VTVGAAAGDGKDFIRQSHVRYSVVEAPAFSPKHIMKWSRCMYEKSQHDPFRFPGTERITNIYVKRHLQRTVSAPKV